jgi:hypothetical protein
MFPANAPISTRYLLAGCVYLLVWALLPWQQVQSQPLSQADAGLATQSVTEIVREKSRTSKDNPLFVDQDVLRIRLVADFQKVLKDRGEERSYHPATLSYTDSSGATVDLNLKIMVRGNRRRDPTVCRFPPIMLNFVRKSTPGTIFSEVNKVKLVTHCVGEDYVLREYLVYKVYNILAEESFRVRLCQIEYVDTLGKRKTEVRYAFMIEDDKEMATRNKARLIPKKNIVRMERTDQRAMARLALFQYMIGNTDWSVPFRHNIDLISTDSLAPPIPVPFDFDYAGMVSAPYAEPPPELGIRTVRERLYRSYTFPENIHREMVNTFNAYRTPIYAVYRQCDELSKTSLKQSLKYLDSFYKTLNNPRQFQNEIVRIGERNESSYVTIGGLEQKKR